MAAAQDAAAKPTTFMIKNIPSRCGRECLKDTIDGVGFRGCYNFLHLPVRSCRVKSQSCGYAFINFHNTEVGARFQELLNSGVVQIRQRVISVGVAHVQGVTSLQRHFERRDTAKRRGAGTTPFFGDVDAAAPLNDTRRMGRSPPTSQYPARALSKATSSGSTSERHVGIDAPMPTAPGSRRAAWLAQSSHACDSWDPWIMAVVTRSCGARSSHPETQETAHIGTAQPPMKVETPVAGDVPRPRWVLDATGKSGR
eukprot:TRINITY_DN18324_c0_g1_i1.p1 TRINITY_DN18324_c0_g1~~TRINITY_DN18324_c0_g1_i1.p1  ORF type:complete len:255 (+),score=23.78 TRINITY_DN18324_c0_g1_i1:94-858(+)